MKKFVTVESIEEGELDFSAWWPVMAIDGEDAVVRKINYGYVLDSPEQEFVVTFSPGQGGNTVWFILNTSVDMGLKYERGHCKTNDKELEDALNLGFTKLTAGWLTGLPKDEA